MSTFALSAPRRDRNAHHGALLKACLGWLQYQRVMAWKNNTGATSTAGGGFVRYGLPGSPDIIGVLPGGKFIGIEVKTGAGRLSELQAAFRIAVENAGGVYLVVRSLDDLDREVRPFVLRAKTGSQPRLTPGEYQGQGSGQIASGRGLARARSGIVEMAQAQRKEGS